MKLNDFWNDNFPPLNLYNCPNHFKYEQMVKGRMYKTVDNQIEKTNMKRRIPINQQMASDIVNHNKHLKAIIEKEVVTITFYDEADSPILEMEKTFPVDGQELVSYYTYVEEYEGD